ncbi:MAG: hypothetical protein ABIR96_01280 [Bdellovibrionota bacterium]
MRSFKQMFLASAIVFAFAAHADNSSDKAAVDSSCNEEAKTANCGDQKVGSGLLKCIHAYKKEHKDFKVSDGCKSAVKKLHADRSTENRESHQKIAK